MSVPGRIIGIGLPYALSVISLICMVFVAVGCTSPTAPASKLYFMKARLGSSFLSDLESELESLLRRRSVLDSVTSSVASTVSSAEDTVSSAATAANQVESDAADTIAAATSTVNKTLTAAIDTALGNAKSNLPDLYLVGLWSYCNGTYSGNTSVIHNCTSPSPSFWFDFASVLGLESSWVSTVFPTALQDAIRYYHRFTQWAITAYLIALISTGLVLLSGLTAVASRWASLVTSFFAMVAMFASFGATLTACLIYATLVGGLKAASVTLGITATLGWRLVAVNATATLCAVAAGVGWLFTVCCCSGHRKKSDRPVSQPVNHVSLLESPALIETTSASGWRSDNRAISGEKGLDEQLLSQHRPYFQPPASTLEEE